MTEQENPKNGEVFYDVQQILRPHSRITIA